MQYKLVQLRNGPHVVYAAAYDEKMHPGLGPAAEAEAVYIGQLKIRERLQRSETEFVVWDVGLGAAANAVTLLRLTRGLPRPLRLVSFDDTSGPLEFALQNSAALEYLSGYETWLAYLLRSRHVEFKNGKLPVTWEFQLGDFPSWLARRSPDRLESEAGIRAANAPKRELQSEHQRADQETGAPHAIMFDAFSPAKNPAMWTLPLFTHLFRALNPNRPCNLTTYSRSTMLRVTLLLAGFFVGRGVATGLKEETTVAANSLSLLDHPLDRRWLERARRSGSAEPMRGPVYRQARLSEDSMQKLERHPQFCQTASEAK